MSGRDVQRWPRLGSRHSCAGRSGWCRRLTLMTSILLNFVATFLYLSYRELYFELVPVITLHSKFASKSATVLLISIKLQSVFVNIGKYSLDYIELSKLKKNHLVIDIIRYNREDLRYNRSFGPKN